MGGEGERLFLCAMALSGACSGWSQPKSLQVSRGCTPGTSGMVALRGSMAAGSSDPGWGTQWVGEVMRGEGWMGTQ